MAVPDFGRIEVDHARVNGVSFTGRSTVRYKRVDGGQASIVATRFAGGPPRSGSFSLVFDPHVSRAATEHSVSVGLAMTQERH